MIGPAGSGVGRIVSPMEVEEHVVFPIGLLDLLLVSAYRLGPPSSQFQDQMIDEAAEGRGIPDDVEMAGWGHQALMGKPEEGAEGAVGDDHQGLAQAADVLGHPDQLGGIPRRGQDHRQTLRIGHGQPVEAGAVAPFHNGDIRADFHEGPAHIVGQSVGEAGADDVDGRMPVEPVHHPLDRLPVQIVQKLAEVVDLPRDEPAGRVGLR